MNFGILALFLSLLLFGLLAFKQLSAPILAPVVTIFLILCFRMPILDSLKTMFMPSAASYFTSYFLVFFAGALFGAVYQHTGAAKSIAKFLAAKSGGKFVAPIIMTITGILTYGGVSGFVVFFVIYPSPSICSTAPASPAALSPPPSPPAAGPGPCTAPAPPPFRTLSP
jgi:H+/gluconate symporter-like permease